jgi:hypothetical protein
MSGNRCRATISKIAARRSNVNELPCTISACARSRSSTALRRTAVHCHLEDFGYQKWFGWHASIERWRTAVNFGSSDVGRALPAHLSSVCFRDAKSGEWRIRVDRPQHRSLTGSIRDAVQP